MTLLTCQRKRGDDLINAIHCAVFDELVSNGLEKFSFESVAHRAGTGKASIYRRWSTRDELIVSAFQARTKQIEASSAPSFTSLRDELLFMFSNTAAQLNSDFGIALREIVSELHRHSGFAILIRDSIIKDRDARITSAINNAISRGEIEPVTLTQAQLDLGPALITQRFFVDGHAPDAEYITHVVDDILMPSFQRQFVS